jgi:cell division protein FtsI/penicillin-binding protein 2
MSQENKPRRLVHLVLGGMSIVALALIGQLIRVQFGPYAPVFAAREAEDQGLTETLPPVRGLIYDRDGRLMASNTTWYLVDVEVEQLTQSSRVEIAALLSGLLSLPYEDLHDQIDKPWESRQEVRIRLTREDNEGVRWPIWIDQGAADVIESLYDHPASIDLSGLALVPRNRRFYPAGGIAGHVLGFVNQEGQGFYGVEGYYDDWLSGNPIEVERVFIPPEAQLQPNPPAGVNLVLTIDLEIQQMVETVLEGAMERTRAESGQIIVMVPSSGEILAMAASPQLDPNDYESWLSQDRVVPLPIGPAVAAHYEPGSTFKVLIMASALDAGEVEPSDIYIDTGMIEIGGHQIENWDQEAWGPQTMVECMAHSLNVCLAYVGAEKLGAVLMYPYLSSFGIGQLTGIDLEGEVPGVLRTPRHPEWTEADLGTNSFGQGVSVTSVQLITAAGAIANGGVMVQPHIVRQVVGPRGVYWPSTTVLGHPIEPETAATLTDMLWQSLQDEASLVGVAGYQLAGKTGTAQIATGHGYDPRWTVASFIGWGPISDPRFIVLVRLDKPAYSPWGSVVAAPVFEEVVERLVVLMEIPPDSVRTALTQSE